jgi:hypothetical protein
MKKTFKEFLQESTAINETTYHDPKFFRKVVIDKSWPFKHELSKTQKWATISAQVHAHNKNTDIESDFAPMDEHLATAQTPSHDAAQHFYDYSKNSSDLNEGLVRRDPATEARAVHLSKAIQETSKPLPEEMHVYSGTSPSVSNSLKVGTKLHSPAFSSTSLHPNVASKFARNHERDAHILHFVLPKGYNRGAYIKTSSDHPGEHEYLLDKGQTWNVTNHEATRKVEHWLGGDNPHVNRHRIHIWTLEPHSAESLQESYIYYVASPDSKQSVTEALEHSDEILKNDFDHAEPSEPHNTAAHMPESRALMDRHGFVIDHKTEAGRDQQRMQFAAVVKHTRHSSSINEMLVKKDTLNEHVQKHVDKINSYLNGAKPLEETHHVYSGLGFNPTKITEHSDGVFKTPAFLSTSLNPAAATAKSNFRRKYWDNAAHENILHVELPKGYTGGRYIGAHSGFPAEQEFLLKPNQKFKIHDHTTVEGPGGITRHIWHAKPLDHIEKLNESLSPLSTDTLKHEFNATKADVIKKNSTDGYARNYDWEDLKDKHPNHEWESDEVSRQHLNLDRLHTESPSKGERYTIHCYTAGRSTDINRDLIAKGNRDYDNRTGRADYYAPQLHKAIREAPALDHNVHSYSAVGFDPSHIVEKGKGTFKTPAFISTSINPHVAFGIAVGKDNLPKYKNGLHMIHFDLPTGYNRSLYINEHAHPFYRHQRELLIKPNSKFQVTTKRMHKMEGMPDLHIWSVKPHESQLTESYIPADEHTINAITSGKHEFEDNDGKLISKFSDPHLQKYSDHVYLTHNDLKAEHRFNPEVHDALSDYSGDSANLNYSLIRNDLDEPDEDGDEEEKEHVRQQHAYIQSGMQNAVPLKHDLHVYSGINPSMKNLKENTTIHMPAYTSSSIHFNGARSFTLNNKYVPNGGHMLHVHLPAGYKRGLYIGDHSQQPNEQEYLLDHNQKFHISHSEKINSGVHHFTLWHAKPTS